MGAEDEGRFFRAAGPLGGCYQEFGKEGAYRAISRSNDLTELLGSVPWEASHSFSSSRCVEIRGPMFTLMTSDGKLRMLAGADLCAWAAVNGKERLLR